VEKWAHYLTWGVGLMAAGLAVYLAWSGLGGWGALAVVAIGTAVVGYGWPLGLALAVLLLFLGYAFRANPGELVFLAFSFALAGAAGHALRERFRAHVRRERRLKQSLALFNRALDRVVRKTSEEEVLRMLPELLSELIRARVELLESRPEEEDGALWLPIRIRGRPVRWLRVLRDEPFEPVEEASLARFAEAVSDHLTLLAEHTEGRLIAELTQAVASADELSGAAEKALRLLTRFFRVDGAGLWRLERGRFYPIAFFGEKLPAEARFYEHGIPSGRGWLWQVYKSGRPLFIQDALASLDRGLIAPDQGVRSVALHPVLGAHRGRVVLVLRAAEPRSWAEDERRLLAVVSRVLGLMLRPYELKERLSTLLSLEHALPEMSEDAFYREVLKAAVRLVPGAEAGSLVVREGEVFRYRAVEGYDLKGLSAIRYREDSLLAWCGLAWHSGRPRLRSRRGGEIERVSLQSAPREVMDRAGRLFEIQQNLCVPIVYKNEVLAVLNLDAFSDAEAFDAESLEVAEAFAVQVAAMVREAGYRRFLEQAALTDPLTGLLNRRAFDQQLSAELARARRAEHPVALLIMDLTRFKEINDRFGHPVGDRALREVAQALSKALRAGDRVFRWGGDEFAVILPYTDREGALAAARRYAEAVRSVCQGPVCLGVNIGVAVYPEDAMDEGGLLQAADGRMYRAKAEGRVFFAD